MKRVLMVVASLVLVCVNGCSGNDSGKPVNEKSSATPSKGDAAQYELELVFTGPWSFVKDSTGKRIVAIAPLIKGHSSLYLRSTSGLLVPTGKYDLKLSGAKPVQSSNPPPRFVPDTPKSISAGLLNTFEATATGDRYVINLPDTQFIQAVYTDPLAYSDAYGVPAPTLSKTYVTKVAFRYTVDSLDVIVNGTAVEASGSSAYNKSIGSEGTIDVLIDDAPDSSTCDDGAKGTYKAMNGLLNTGFYVDFPPYDVSCQKEDPQNPKGGGTGMGGMNENAYTAMKNSVLSGLRKLESYTKNLSKDPGFKESGQQILKRLSKIRDGVQGWPKSGPDDKQRTNFDAGLRDLRSFVIERVEIKESYRSNIVNVIDDVVPFNMSGKNCKAPLMLLVSP